MSKPPSSKGKRVVKAWAVLYKDTFRGAYEWKNIAKSLEMTPWDTTVPCEITYQLPKDDK